MTGFEEAKTALGLETIFSIISGKCVTQLGRDSIARFTPYEEKTDLLAQIESLNILARIIETNGRLPLRPLADVRTLLKKIEPQNSFLEIKECQEVQSILEVTEEIRHFFKSQDLAETPLQYLVNLLDEQKSLLNQLQYTIEPSGEIFDNASKELKAIRKKLNALKTEVHQKLERISVKHSEHLMEDFITLRDGRLVLPVREFSVSKISGIVHGQSSSGATKYVEPMIVVGLNNEIQELLTAERHEIVRILTRLSSMIRESGAALLQNQDIITRFDTLQARVFYGEQISANFPEISDEHAWLINGGRHPILLERIGADTVPLNLELGHDFSMLVISGPNAGGKTVAMKTVGLLQLMLQCAIPIPVDAGSRFPVCKQVFVQIGDKQSIENDLSTFSSHITGLNKILKNIQDSALVLIDEIGIGTEPSGGAALAVAILEELLKPGIITIVSTHQNQLKVFAAQTTGVQNGAMQFDIKQLKPLFILETGVPGSSFTFDICRRFGTNENLLQRAKELEGSGNQNIDKLLNDISQKSAFYQNAVRELSLKQSHLDGLINLYEKNSSEIKSQRRNLEKEAKQQAREIVDNANKKIEAIIREIRESAAEKNIVKKLRTDLKDYTRNLKDKDLKKVREELSAADLKVGQKVRSLTYNITGNISKIFNNKKSVEIEREGLKLTIKISELELLSETGQPLNKDAIENITHVSSHVSHEIDIRGCDVEDGLQQAQTYLESAVNSDWNEVTIIHGKGTGVLRNAIQQMLKKNKEIKDFRSGRYGEGDAGVTVVTLK